MRLLSVNVGKPRELDWRGRKVLTSIWKAEVPDRRWVSRLNVAGDAQADLIAHGGEHRAVYVYDVSAYRHWERELGRDDFVNGQFGENFTVEGLPDDEVCVGDRYRIGDALFEVTQPRVTCYKVGLRMEEPRMPALLYTHGRPGFYLRVLEQGAVGAGDAIERVAVGPEAMTVRELSALLYLPGQTPRQLGGRSRSPPFPRAGGTRSRRCCEQARPGRERQPGARAAQQRPAGLAGAAPVPRRGRDAREPVDRLVRARAGRRRAAARVPPGPVPDRPRAAGGRAASTAAQLLAVGSARRPPLPSQRQARARGPVTPHLHDRVERGDVIDVGAPRGLFTLDPASGDGPIALVSAGVGATPVLSMLESLAEQGARREVWWIQGARNRAEHPFAEEARRHLAALPGARSHIRYSRPAAGDVPGRDYDAQGRLTLDVLQDLGVPREADHYLCGPLSWMRDLSAGLLAWGVAPEHVHTEIFGSEPLQGAARPPHPPPGAPGTGPEVAFTTSGLTVRWDPEFGSLLELAEACDVPARWSCRTGRLPHLRVRARRRRARLPPGPAGPARGRSCPDLLQPAELGRGARAVA